MIAAWHGTKLTDPPEKRFSEALSDAAVSITITAVTDVVSFAIGTWNPLPGVQIFCVYTAAAMFFELIYQCTFYAAVMALVGKAECQAKHCITFTPAVALEDASKRAISSLQCLSISHFFSETTYQRRFRVGTMITKLFRPTVQQDTKHHPSTLSHNIDPPAVTPNPAIRVEPEPELSYVQKFFRDRYGPLLLHPIGKVCALILFLAYLAVAAYGCSQMGSGLQPEKLSYSSHYASKYLRSNYYFDNGMQVCVTVENVPNLTLSSERQIMLDMASEFEDSPYTYGANATQFWLRQYLRYLNKSEIPVEDTRQQWCDMLKDWLKTDTSGQWILSIRWVNASEGADACQIQAFRFFVASKGAWYPTTSVYMVPFFRNVSQTYSYYKVSTYQQYIYPFTDQYLMINPTTIRNSLVSFAVMICK